MNQSKTCIATIVIGQKYQDDFDRFCRLRMQNYCTRHGYELKVITDVIRELPGKKLTWQKILLPEMSWWNNYAQICIMDSDILIAKDAPPLPCVPAGYIGCVPDKLPDQINSGVLIYAPGDKVAECFKDTLDSTEPYWDQRELSKVMRSRNMEFTIDPGFNRQFFFRCLSLPATLFKRHWFYHALGGKRKLFLLHFWLLLTGH